MEFDQTTWPTGGPVVNVVASDTQSATHCHETLAHLTKHLPVLHVV